MTKRKRIQQLEEEARKLRKDINDMDVTELVQRARIHDLTLVNDKQEDKIRQLTYLLDQLIIGIFYSDNDKLKRLVDNVVPADYWRL